MSTIYGEMQSEKIAEDNEIARKIVREINLFGINERQRWLIIHALALELESIEDMKSLVASIKQIGGDKISLTKIFGVEEQSEEVGDQHG
jgi:hypothetical protein